MKHLYRPGETSPVCGKPVGKGEVVMAVLYPDLCRVCMAWHAAVAKAILHRRRDESDG